MLVRMRITLDPIDDRVEEMRVATNLRRDVFARAPVGVDPVHPLRGIHRDDRDKGGRRYFEFSTEAPDEVRRVFDELGFGDRGELGVSPSLPGLECLKCGNVAGPVPPTVCPNCHFRDISPCPICHQEVSRESYIPIASDLFLCPNCDSRVRLRFIDPMFLRDGNYNQPLVVVNGVRVPHEIR